MFIETEETPNPNSLKFIPHRQMLPPQQSRSYNSESEAGDSPLAQSLFMLPGVAAVFIASDFVSVSKEDATDWQNLRAAILVNLLDFFNSGAEVIKQTAPNNQAVPVEEGDFDPSDQAIVDKVTELIEQRVRPVVLQDGGDIRFHGFREGTVFLLLQGACAGCPSSALTLRDGIENMLKFYIPEVKQVQAIDQFAN